MEMGKIMLTQQKYFPYFDKELRKTWVTDQLLWQGYWATEIPVDLSYHSLHTG